MKTRKIGAKLRVQCMICHWPIYDSYRMYLRFEWCFDLDIHFSRLIGRLFWIQWPWLSRKAFCLHSWSAVVPQLHSRWEQYYFQYHQFLLQYKINRNLTLVPCVLQASSVSCTINVHARYFICAVIWVLTWFLYICSPGKSLLYLLLSSLIN